jgi:hypothetical protein
MVNLPERAGQRLSRITVCGQAIVIHPAGWDDSRQGGNYCRENVSRSGSNNASAFNGKEVATCTRADTSVSVPCVRPLHVTMLSAYTAAMGRSARATYSSGDRHLGRLGSRKPCTIRSRRPNWHCLPVLMHASRTHSPMSTGCLRWTICGKQRNNRTTPAWLH